MGYTLLRGDSMSSIDNGLSMKPFHDQGTAGFTLVELLVVVAIIIGLAAIAVPQYSQYRAKAFDVRALEDLRHGALAQELYFADTERYLSCTDDACTALPSIARLSEGVSLSFNERGDNFSGSSQHVQGTGRVFEWDSEHGGLVVD